MSIRSLELVATASPSPVVTWADQLTAYGTVGAVLLSLGLAIYGAIATGLEKRKRRKQAREAAERAQAEQLHWWHELCAEHPLPYEDDSSLTNAYRTLSLDSCWGEILVVENTSSAPIHELVLFTPRYFLPRVAIFMPGEIGPNSRRTFHISGFGASLIDQQFQSPGYVTFSDAQGRRWRREKSGYLTRATTTTVEDLEAAEAIHRQLLHTLRDISNEQQWTGPANQKLREIVSWLATAPSTSRPAQSRLIWQQLYTADELAFRLLQHLPRRHYERKVAVRWWEWRSGVISLEDLIDDPHVFYTNQSRAIIAARKAQNTGE